MSFWEKLLWYLNNFRLPQRLPASISHSSHPSILKQHRNKMKDSLQQHTVIPGAKYGITTITIETVLLLPFLLLIFPSMRATHDEQVIPSTLSWQVTSSPSTEVVLPLHWVPPSCPSLEESCSEFRSPLPSSLSVGNEREHEHYILKYCFHSIVINKTIKYERDCK